jgi:hypothetical protein
VTRSRKNVQLVNVPLMLCVNAMSSAAFTVADISTRSASAEGRTVTLRKVSIFWREFVTASAHRTAFNGKRRGQCLKSASLAALTKIREELPQNSIHVFTALDLPSVKRFPIGSMRAVLECDIADTDNLCEPFQHVKVSSRKLQADGISVTSFCDRNASFTLKKSSGPRNIGRSHIKENTNTRTQMQSWRERKHVRTLMASATRPQVFAAANGSAVALCDRYVR